MGYGVFLNNDNLVQLNGLTDTLTGAYLNTATVIVTLIDNQGNPQQGPISMTYLASSNGVYQGVLPASSTLSVGVGYRCVVSVTNTDGGTATWDLPVKVQNRENPN